MIFTVDISGPNEDEAYEELVGCLQDMKDAGLRFEYDILAVDVPLPTLDDADAKIVRKYGNEETS